MTQRFVTVGDDFKLPPQVVVSDGNLPPRLAPDSVALKADLTPLASKTELALKVDLSEVNNSLLKFDQFPLPLTDATAINGGVTSTSIVRVAGDSIYAAFWGADMNPYIAHMKDGDSTWQVINLANLAGNPLNAPAPSDEHNGLSIVVDGAGFIHVSGNHHRVPLNYIRSSVANSIVDGWEAPGMVGIDEVEVTYPQFIKTNDGNLIFLYRSGTSSDGDLMMNTYSTTTKLWTRVGMVLKGHDWLTSADDMSAYPGKFAYDVSPGRLHMWWVWRDTTSIDSNIDFCYMYTTDKGATWKTAAGANVTLPVTPADASVKVFAGGSGHVVAGTCVDSTGGAYASLRMADGENRLYKRVGSSITYTVMGTNMGHVGLIYSPDGIIYGTYTGPDSYIYIKQVSPTIGTAIKLFPWIMPNNTPGFYTPDPGSYSVRMFIAPARRKSGNNYGGVLTFETRPATIAALAAGTTVLPKPRSIPPIVDPVRHGFGSYGMVPDMCYGPTGPRGFNSNNLPNGAFRGTLITASRAGKVVEATINVTTAGAAGAKVRIVAYRTDGKLVTQSADIDVSTTGQKTIPMVFNIGKNEQMVLGTLHHSSTGISAILTSTSGNHDSRIPFGSPTNYFSGVKSGWSLSSVPVPAVDTTSFLDPVVLASQPTNDNIPLIAIKCGARPGDWLSGSE